MRRPRAVHRSAVLNAVQDPARFMNVAETLTGQRGPTAAWGDAEARRRDILDAAAAILDRGGYQALTMRAVAEGAAVSPGTIYHHFRDKEHVLAALMELRHGLLRSTIEEASTTAGVSGVLRAVVHEATELWRCIGRSAAGWAQDILGPELDAARGPSGAGRAWRSMLEALERAMDEAAANEGRRLRQAPAVVPFVWGGLMGLADDLVNGWSRSAGVTDRELIEFTVEALSRGVTSD